MEKRLQRWKPSLNGLITSDDGSSVLSAFSRRGFSRYSTGTKQYHK